MGAIVVSTFVFVGVATGALVNGWRGAVFGWVVGFSLYVALCYISIAIGQWRKSKT